MAPLTAYPQGMVPQDAPGAGSPSPGSRAEPTATQGTEIERKFLVATLPDSLDQLPHERIAQGYLSIDPSGAEVRLRRRGYHTLLTVKSGRGLARAEEELLIDGPRFERLWAGTSGRRIEKTRYRQPLGDGLTAEIDLFEGGLAGFVMAEVEFPSLEAAAAFRPPSWLRPEVTGDPRYGNARLAIDGAPERKTVGEHALLEGEPIVTGLIHVALAQVDAAADALQGRDAEEYGKAVHTARKAFKRGRAIVRVARDGIGSEVAARDNAALRDAGARLSGARDAQVVVQTLEGLMERSPEDLTTERVGTLLELLRAEYEAADRAARADAGAVDDVLAILQAARADIERWAIGGDAAAVVADGFRRIHRKGRATLKAAGRSGEHGAGTSESATEAFHELRKRAKDLWHAAELLEVAAPKRMRALAAAAHKLADHVGDDHDLAVLEQRVRDHPEAFLDPADADVLVAVIAKRRAKLQRKAIAVADEIYGEKPGQLIERIHELAPGE